VVALAALGAVVVLPAALALLGRRVDWLPLRPRRPAAAGAGFWHRTASAVMRRPLPIATAVVALLLVLGAPFLGVKFGLPDDRVLPASASSRQVADQIRHEFRGDQASALTVVAGGSGDPASHLGQVRRYAAALSRVPGVAQVDTVTGSYVDGRQAAQPGEASRRFARPDGLWLSVVPAVEPMSTAGERLVGDVRAVPAPFPVQVGGSSAELVDTKASLFGRMPLALGLIALVTFTLLFLLTGSVVLPLKALVLNLLSLTATFGAMVWVFQQGHLSSLLGFTPTGTIDTTMPMLMFCVTFGLSMDYEVFLLSRIKEEHDRGTPTVQAVALGLERVGRIVTTAAALLAIVFVAFATSKVAFIKLFGIGAALAVVADATLVRALLVPAFMRLAGRANWWAPRPLRRLHDRFGLRETAAVPALAEAAAGGAR
jgi:RND superfamily putative drug exporter